MEAVTESYKIACSQVVKTIENLKKEQAEKIPSSVVEYYKNNMDQNYSFEIDSSRSLMEQDYSKEAAIILTAISKKYLLDENESKKVDEILRFNSSKLEKEKRDLYNPDNIFNKNEGPLKIESIDTQMIEYKESIFTKIVNFFKNIFKR